MTKQEAIRRLYELIADINAEEVADHIRDGVSLQDWTNVWRCAAKDALRVLEDKADTPQTECRTCKWAEVSWTSHYCDDCKAHNKYEPNDIPQTDECEGCKHYVYQLGCTHHATCEYEPKEPQTDCGWK